MPALILQNGEGPTLSYGGVRITYKTRSETTNDALGIYEITLPAGSPGAGPHYHKIMTEMFYVLSGALSLMVDGQPVEAGQGAFVQIPPGVVHAFGNRGVEPARFMLSFTPALAREGFFEGLADLARSGRIGDEGAMQDLMARYDQYPTSGVEGWSETPD
jgi:quercetin dioxygenase-like cupin family protein